MNKYARNNKYFAAAKEFGVDCFSTKTLPDITDSLNNSITDNFQQLGSAEPAFLSHLGISSIRASAF